MEAMKEQRRIERERKRKERETEMEKRKERARQRKRKRSPTPVSSDAEDQEQPGSSVSDAEDQEQPGTSVSRSPTSSSSEADDHPRTSSRNIRVPVRYRDDDSESSDGSQSDTICDECQSREPVGYDIDNIYWINCRKCQEWFHVICICGRNYAKKQYVCKEC